MTNHEGAAIFLAETQGHMTWCSRGKVITDLNWMLTQKASATASISKQILTQ